MRLFIVAILLINCSFVAQSATLNTLDNSAYILDSIISFDGSHTKKTKEQYTYTGTDDKTLSFVEGFSWNSGLGWKKSYEKSYGYDPVTALTIKETGFTLNLTSGVKDTEYLYNYGYDASNNYSLEEFYLKSKEDNVLRGKTRSAYLYNLDGAISEVVTSIWINGGWSEDQKFVYRYDSKKNQVGEEIFQRDHTLKRWMKGSKTEKIFNADNTISVEEYYNGDKVDVSADWNKVSKISYTYANGQLVQKMVYTGNLTGNWVESTKYDYTYKSNSIDVVTESVKMDTGWQALVRDVYSYTNARVAQIKSDLWNEKTSTWIPYFEKNYIQSSNLSEEEHYTYDAKGNRSALKKFVEEKDSFGNVVLKEQYSWDSGAWQLEFSNTADFNNETDLLFAEKYSGSEGYYKAEYEYLDKGYPSLNKIYEWNSAQSNWLLSGSTNYYYRGFVTIIEPTIGEKIKVETYPDLLKIDSNEHIASVRVYTMQGRQIYQGQDLEINTSSWEKAPHIVSVSTDSFNQSVKVLIK